MADTVTTDKTEKASLPKLPPLPPQVVTRKGNDIADGKEREVECELKTYQIVKGNNAGVQYLAPEVTLGNLRDIITWIGLPNAVNILQVYLKRAFWALWWRNTNKDGSFNMVGFLKEAEDFAAASLKLAEIRKKVDELQAELTTLLDTGNLGTNPDGTPTDDLVKVKEIGAEIRGYKEMEEKRSRKTDDDKPEAEDEPAIRTN